MIFAKIYQNFMYFTRNF